LSRTHLSINGSLYQFARKDAPRVTGGRQFSVAASPWQPGDPAQKLSALWQVDGPALYSYEEIPQGQPEGHLAVAWTDGTDSRWTDTHVLAPALTGITLSGSDTPFSMTLLDQTALLDQNTGLDVSPISGNVEKIDYTVDTAGTAYYAYFMRGNYVTKVNLSTLAVAETKVFADITTDLIATQTPTAVRELSVALTSTAYQVAAPISTTDTWNANTSSVVQRIFGMDAQRVVGLSLPTATSGQITVQGNILTSTTTMMASAWATVTNIVGAQIVPTGFITDAARWLISTSRGPYPIDPKLGSPYPLIPEMDNNTETGRNPSYWSFLGALLPSRYGVRWQKSNQGRSFGVETFPENRTVVQGYPTAIDSSTRWNYQSVYNVNTGTTWLLAFHPDTRETRPNVVASPFVIGKFASSSVSRAMKWVGTANQYRSTQILLLGKGTEAAYMIVGETPTEIDDTAYRYTSTGTGYFTELRRYPNLIKDIEAIEFESANCTANQTITVSLVSSGDAAGATTVTLNGTTAGVNDTIKTNGYQRRLFVSNAGVPNTSASGRRFYPQLAFSTNTSSTSPQVIGPIRVYYTLRPVLTETITTYLQLQDDQVSTAYDQLVALQALENAAPVVVQDDFYGNTYSVRVKSVDAPPELLDQGGSPDRPRDGSVYVVPLTMVKWITTGTGITP